MPLRSDWDQVMATQMDQDGYAVVEGAIEPEDLAALRARLDAQTAGEAARGQVYHEIGKNRRIFNLLNKGRIFQKLALHPVALAASRHLLGKDFLLSTMSANILYPPGVAQYVHRDQLPDFRCPVVVQLMWAIDDFTVANGATRVIKGSHKWGSDLHMDQPQLEALVKPLEAPAGSAIIFGGFTVHAAGANTTDHPRRGILTYYSKPYYRQSENYALSLSPQVYESAGDELLGLLGFRSHATFGMVDGPPSTDGEFLRKSCKVPRPTSYSGPLDATGALIDA
jgi:ectoine hydroxylase-related dioxygenase (phytanoyl-CoA dioxygenase family)